MIFTLSIFIITLPFWLVDVNLQCCPSKCSRLYAKIFTDVFESSFRVFKVICENILMICMCTHTHKPYMFASLVEPDVFMFRFSNLINESKNEARFDLSYPELHSNKSLPSQASNNSQTVWFIYGPKQTPAVSWIYKTNYIHNSRVFLYLLHEQVFW